MSGLFTHYEERPLSCSAVLIWFDTIEDIARYYGESGYESHLNRTTEGVGLTISHSPYKNHEAFELGYFLPTNSAEPFKRAMLVYGHPPHLEDEEEFRQRYREVKELP